jgi:glycine hydroxymethyltransferase
VIDGLRGRLQASLIEQERALRSSLLLNPVENVPFSEDLAVAAGSLHGLYNTDKVRTREQRLATDHQFAGRQAVEADSRAIYEAWARALGAEDATLRVLSGLHAHIILFMSMARAGEKVLLLPVEAGGHLSGKAILERLGLTTIDMAVDVEGMCVDVERTLERCADRPPDYVFVDRSEGLVYEDFGWLAGVAATASVYDASQYLTNVVCRDHPNPFDWNFDLMMASVHKNFPGPQKALLATRCEDERWRQILGGVSTYVSNMHFASTYAAGLTLARSHWLADYSSRMLRVALLLEDELAKHGVPVVRRRRDLPPTHHVWIREGERKRAFTTYERLEQCLIMTNYRKLPYSLGHGLRLGVNAAVRLGLDEGDVPELAELIADIRRSDPSAELRRRARSFNERIWSRS